MHPLLKKILDPPLNATTPNFIGPVMLNVVANLNILTDVSAMPPSSGYTRLNTVRSSLNLAHVIDGILGYLDTWILGYLDFVALVCT